MSITTKAVLATTDEVAARIGEDGLRILEVDEDTDAYGRGHLPTALGVHWKNDLQDPFAATSSGPRLLPR